MKSTKYFVLFVIIIYGIKGDFTKALHQINVLLFTNMKNIRTIGLKASIKQRICDCYGAKKTLGNILNPDLLNFMIGNEVYLIAMKTSQAKERRNTKSLTYKKN